MAAKIQEWLGCPQAEPRSRENHIHIALEKMRWSDFLLKKDFLLTNSYNLAKRKSLVHL